MVIHNESGGSAKQGTVFSPCGCTSSEPCRHPYFIHYTLGILLAVAAHRLQVDSMCIPQRRLARTTSGVRQDRETNRPSQSRVRQRKLQQAVAGYVFLISGFLILTLNYLKHSTQVHSLFSLPNLDRRTPSLLDSVTTSSRIEVTAACSSFLCCVYIIYYLD